LYYEKVLGAKIVSMMRNEQAPSDMRSPPERRHQIMHGQISMDGQMLMASDGAAGALSEAAGLFDLPDRQ